MTRRGIVVLAVACIAAIAAASAQAAAPRIILVDGGTLPRRLVLANWWDNLSVVQEAAVAPVAALPGPARPSFRLSFFWGPEWNHYIDSGKPLDALRPSQTPYHGRFWPAVGRLPAIVDVGHGANVGPRRATTKLLRVLARRGVPVRCRAKGCRRR